MKTSDDITGETPDDVREVRDLSYDSEDNIVFGKFGADVVIVAEIDPSEHLFNEQIDADVIGRKMAAALSMYQTLIAVRAWLIEKHSPASHGYNHHKDLWKSPKAFAEYERINAAISFADDGES